MNFIDSQVVQDGNDILLQFGSSSIKVPEAKAKKLIEGGYVDKTVVLGIRPPSSPNE